MQSELAKAARAAGKGSKHTKAAGAAAQRDERAVVVCRGGAEAGTGGASAW